MGNLNQRIATAIGVSTGAVCFGLVAFVIVVIIILGFIIYNLISSDDEKTDCGDEDRDPFNKDRGKIQKNS